MTLKLLASTWTHKTFSNRVFILFILLFSCFSPVELVMLVALELDSGVVPTPDITVLYAINIS